jgi:PAS domain S-box-containing protein
MLDPDGRISNWNSGAEAIKGYSADEVVGEHFSRFYTEEDRSSGEPARALETALREGKYENEAVRVRKDGSLFWASVVIDPIYDETGRHVGFAKITRDVTERKRAQDEIEEARAAVAQSQKLQALGELTGGIAHDFNNLMTVIAGSTELLLKRPDMPEEKKRRYLEAIAETTKRATTLTSHLLAFGRRQPIRPEVIDLGPRLDAFVEMLARTLGSHIEVVLELAPAVPPVEVDPAELETALLNAAFNARDAMPEGGRLTIATGQRRDKVWIELRDTGSGMPAEILDRVFEPFFTTKEVGKGTGLGLSQIHGFAAQAGGAAEIESRPASGTVLRILLPASAKAVAAEKPETPAAALPEGLRVLVAEDNDQVREFASNLLVELGCVVIEAAGGTEALELLQREEVDLLFSDIVMPGMSGLDLAAAVRERHPELPILLASGYSAEIARSGATEFRVLAKPYGGEALSAAIAGLLAAARQRAA